MCLTWFWSPVLLTQLQSTSWDSRSKADQGKHSGGPRSLPKSQHQAHAEDSSSDPVTADLHNRPMSRLKCPSQEAVSGWAYQPVLVRLACAPPAKLKGSVQGKEHTVAASLPRIPPLKLLEVTWSLNCMLSLLNFTVAAGQPPKPCLEKHWSDDNMGWKGQRDDDAMSDSKPRFLQTT